MSKKRIKKGVAFLLAIIMSLSLVPISGINGVVRAAETKDDNSERPSKFNLNDYGYVTSVKNQGAWGTCWGFASIAAAESSILSELGLTVDEYREKYGVDLDLSEHQLAWFVYTPLPTDKESQELYDNQGGEGLFYISYDEDEDEDEDEDINGLLDVGGMPIKASSLFASANGPTLESTVPYRGKNAEMTYYVLYNDGTTGLEDGSDDIEQFLAENDDIEKAVPAFYSTTDDWSVDEQYRQKSVAMLEESYLIMNSDIEDEDGNFIYDEDALNDVKDQLLAGRAVVLAYYAVSSTYDELGNVSPYYNIETAAQYVDEYTDINHGVTIVGYDDNYSKDNFNITPPGDGAWIIKNSWGSSYDDFYGEQGYEGSGYFYLSYYDRTIYMFEAFDFDVSYWNTTQEEFILDQYDYMPGAADLFWIPDDDCVWSANVFTAKEDELLREISFSTATGGENVAIAIYLLNDDYANPTDGIVVGTINEYVKYGGYHRVTLPESVYIREGTNYSIVVYQELEGFPILSVCDYFNEECARLYGMYIAANAVVNKGESFAYIDGTWQDWSDIRDDVRVYSLSYNSEDAEYLVVDNFPYKAFLSIVQGEAGDNLSYKIDENGTLSITGSGAMYDYTSSYLPAWYHESDIIKSITIGEGVTSIGDYAFYGLDLVNTITFEGDVPELGENWYGNLEGTNVIYSK